MNLPKVSIITPSYNQAKFLEETIQSVISQDYPHIEYIIIDGGSSDGSIEIIKKYESRISYWVSEKDQGQADAINKGFAVATGEYIGWLNSDDCLSPGAIKKVVDAFILDPDVEFIYGDIDQGESPLTSEKLPGREISLEQILISGDVPIPQQGSMWRRSVLDRIGGLGTAWHVVLDREFFMRMALKCKIQHLPVTLGFFRYHADSKSISQMARWIDELPQMLKVFLDRDDLPKNIVALKKMAMARILLTCASLSFRVGDYRRGCMFLIKSFLSSPLIFICPDVLRTIIKRVGN
jgi:cellulose synthase/poly-beta-1,6-N-acetylglucosamine synthase-like glycosyltransferase